MNELDVSAQIREYLATKVLFEADPTTFTDETELIGNLVDSLGLMQLVGFMDEQYGVTFDDAEVNAQNFRTLGEMDRLVFAKLAALRLPTG